MDIKVLSKYSKSKLNGSLIKDMYVYLNGVIVNAENGSQKVFLFESDWNSENLCDFDADYIICEIQGDVDIEVLK